MKNKYIFVAVMLVCILAGSIGLTTLYVSANRQSEENNQIVIVTSFYPMYIAALNIVGDTQGVTLKNLSEPQTGCLHDFQLTPEDMKLLSHADVFVVNGGGMESFLEDVAGSCPDLAIVQACEDVDLLESPGEANAHAWMSVADYRIQVASIAAHLSGIDAAHADSYEDHAEVYDRKLAQLQKEQESVRQALSGTDIILFHDAFSYVAKDYQMNVCYTLNLDEERQVSAGEVAEVLAAIREDDVPYILAEELYGSSMGSTVAAESDAEVVYLDPLIRGDYDADSYLDGMRENIRILGTVRK